ncbi:hypothetical protein SAMN05421874_1752 [Nonomuraea maritima]|uniref:Uncharacterized protein n=1 Tax=Nonomuraea maritima TaxID=683260 RepID=A0A1G9SZC9_9ACTN|nr:hypothetical protein SAMN05421874_1752 [Nonomuraea maritima]
MRITAAVGPARPRDRATATTSTPGDITLLLLANSGFAGLPRKTALAASRRLLACFFEAFLAQRPVPLPPPAPMGWRDIRRTPVRS